MEELPVIEVEGGVSVPIHVPIGRDWGSMRILYESGMRVTDIAKHYKLSNGNIADRARKEGWLNPQRVEGLRKQIVQRQKDALKRVGKATDVNAVKAQIWEERVEARNERIHEIVMDALEGCSKDYAKRLIKSPQGLLQLAQASRLITGEEAAQAQASQQVAVNVSFLRSSRPVDVVDAEEAG